MKRSTWAGIGSSACMRCRRRPRRSSCSTRPKPRFGMNGNGCAGSTASGVSSGNTSAMKRSSQPGALGFGQLVGTDDGDPGVAQFLGAARASRPAAPAISSSTRLMDRVELLAGVSPSWLGVVDAGVDLAAQARDADHVEFVEVVGRDRQEAQPLEQRMAAVVGLFQHPLVERQPGQLAVDETTLGGRFDLRGADGCGSGRHGSVSNRSGRRRRMRGSFDTDPILRKSRCHDSDRFSATY